VQGSESLTVRELVLEAGLGLELVTGEVGLDKVIKGIHLSDLEDPTPWMTSGMVLVTTGESFARSAEAGVRLLNRLAEIDVVALCVGVGHYLDHVPHSMIEHAQRLRIPIVEAPLSVPFRTIFQYVYNSLASTDMHRLRRSLAVQAHLLDLLLEERTTVDLISDLSSILALPVALFDAHGTCLAAASPDGRAERASERLWSAYADAKCDAGPLGVLEVGHERFHYRRVLVHGCLERVLAAKAPQAPPSEFVETALSFAQKLLVLDSLRTRDEVMRVRRMRALLLDDFLSGRSFGDQVRQRLRELDIDLDAEPWRLIMCEALGSKDDFRHRLTSEEQTFNFRSRLLALTEAFFSERSIRFLSQVEGDAVVSLAVLGELSLAEAKSLMEEMGQSVAANLDVSVIVAAAGPMRGVDRPAWARRQLEEALRRAMRTGSRSPGRLVLVSLYDEVAGRLRFLDEQPTEALRELYNRLIAPLADHDAMHHTCLVSTLQTFLEHRLSTHDTAAALYVHRNTLHKRLQRIEALLDVDLSRMDDIVELAMALRASEMLGKGLLDRPSPASKADL